MEEPAGSPTRFERMLDRVAAAVLLAVMLIVFADVCARYLFSSPFAWSYEFIGMYLMPTLFYFALSSTLAARHHVAVDVLRPRMPRPLAHAFDLLGSVATAAVFATVAFLFARSSAEKFVTDSVVLGVVQWPNWIPDAIVAVGSATIVARLAGAAAGHAASLAGGRDRAAHDASTERDD